MLKNDFIIYNCIMNYKQEVVMKQLHNILIVFVAVINGNIRYKNITIK